MLGQQGVLAFIAARELAAMVSRHAWVQQKGQKQKHVRGRERQLSAACARGGANAARPMRPARRAAQARGVSSARLVAASRAAQRQPVLRSPPGSAAVGAVPRPSGRAPDDRTGGVRVGAAQRDGGARLQVQHQLPALGHKLRAGRGGGVRGGVAGSEQRAARAGQAQLCQRRPPAPQHASAPSTAQLAALLLRQSRHQGHPTRTCAGSRGMGAKGGISTRPPATGPVHPSTRSARSAGHGTLPSAGASAGVPGGGAQSWDVSGCGAGGGGQGGWGG